jgi:hypothetical protein
VGKLQYEDLVNASKASKSLLVQHVFTSDGTPVLGNDRSISLADDFRQIKSSNQTL